MSAKHLARRARRYGITNKQASYLAALQRAAGERYTGNSLSRQHAAREIDRLLEQRKTPLEENDRSPPDTA